MVSCVSCQLGVTMKDSSNVGCRPFLAMLAVQRTGATSELPGRYSAQQDVWVIDGHNGPIPLVASYHGDSVAPVTKVKGERDEFRTSGILELLTKTRKELERDDVSRQSAIMLPELITKTDEVSRPDDPSLQFILELATKTENIRERDD